jgi:hypothetical protein
MSRVLPARLGSQRSSSWATIRAAGLPSLAACPAMSTSGFPGVGGVMTGGTAGYVRIRQQPTAPQETPDPRLQRSSRP